MRAVEMDGRGGGFVDAAGGPDEDCAMFDGVGCVLAMKEMKRIGKERKGRGRMCGDSSKGRSGVGVGVGVGVGEISDGVGRKTRSRLRGS